MTPSIALLAAWVGLAPSPADGPAILAPDEVLVLPSTGRGGRAALGTDAIAAALVAGTHVPPKEGDVVQPAEGPARTWRKLKRSENGSFQAPELRGGHAAAVVHAEADGISILEASGHGSAFVGGVARAGDPYGNGSLRLPVTLKAGDNPILFSGGRGSLKFRLVPPKAAAMIDLGDATLPDLVVDEGGGTKGAVVILNASNAPLEGASLSVHLRTKAGDRVVFSISTDPVPVIPPLGVRKVPFRIPAAADAPEGKAELKLDLILAGSPTPIDTATTSLSVVPPSAKRKRTFVSEIDGSVQYYGFVPASAPPPAGKAPGLILTLHGASVEGIGQARAYGAKPWADVVAPTNRRPYGFDWEDWGRLDAIEVLDLASKSLGSDPRRTYLTGHSMGGHGTWHVGVTFPDRFAAIAPSAGWVSMASYAGARRPDGDDPVAALVARATLPSDTLAFAPNLTKLGVYILHGDADDNVPVTQARTMRAALGAFHPDFAYYERPGAGHCGGTSASTGPP